MKWLLVLLGVLANAGASVIAKTAPPIMTSNLLRNFGNWRLLAALGLYGIAFLLYTSALQRLPLNVAHPVSTAGAILLVGLCSAVIFHERFDPLRIGGYGLLAAGICLLVLSGMGKSA